MTKNDFTTICMLSIGAAAAGYGWVRNIWGNGSERTYEMMKKSGNKWTVMRLLKIEPTPENCIRFLRNASAVGLFVVIPLVVFTIVRFALSR